MDALRSKRVMNLEFGDETTISDVVAYLRIMTGLNFFVTPRVQMQKADARVPLHVDNVRVYDILDIMAGQNGLKWDVRDRVVHIATTDERSGSYTLRYHHVSDLVDAEPRPAQAVVVEERFSDRSWFAGRVPLPLTKAETLVATIRALIDPDGWADKNTTIEVHEWVLLVRAPQATHEKIARYLWALRIATGRR